MVSGAARCSGVLRRLRGDKQGVTAVVVALSMTTLLGFGGLAIDVGLWYGDKRVAQNAADSAAYSAALDAGSGDNTAGVIAAARAISAQYGVTNGAGGTTVVVNTPPTSGPHTGAAGAVEVVISRPETLFFSSFFIHSVQVSARAVATAGASSSKYCLQALDVSASVTSVSINNGATVDISLCGIEVNGAGSQALQVTGGATINATSVSVVGGYVANNGGSINAASKNSYAPAVLDPYQGTTIPAAGVCHAIAASYSNGGSYTISPGTYCLGLSIANGASVTMQPGVYLIEGGSFSLQGGATLNATSGVTIVLTGALGLGYATANIGNGTTMNLVAPAIGATAGLAIIQDRNAPRGGTNNFVGGSTMNITGALYFPTQTVAFSNGSSNNSTCTEVIGYDLTFTGGSKFGATCAGTGVLGIGAANTALVE